MRAAFKRRLLGKRDDVLAIILRVQAAEPCYATAKAAIEVLKGLGSIFLYTRLTQALARELPDGKFYKRLTKELRIYSIIPA